MYTYMYIRMYIFGANIRCGGRHGATMEQVLRHAWLRLCTERRTNKGGPAAAVAVHEYGWVSCSGPEHEGPRTNERPRTRGILARSAFIMAGKTYARTVYDELAVRCEVSPRKAPA